MRTARALVAALAFCTTLPAAALAQVTTADLIGRVTDTSGAVLPGVTVTVVKNTPIFNVLGSALGTSTFVVISNVGNSIARQMQFAARFTF